MSTEPNVTAEVAKTDKMLALLEATPIDTNGVFQSGSSFALAQRMARALAASLMVPETYQRWPVDKHGKEKGENVAAEANCLIAIEYAARLRMSPLMVMQNVDMIYGRPAMRGQMLIGLINAHPDLEAVTFEWVGEPNTPAWGCRAVSKRRSTNAVVTGPWVTWRMVVAEGWNKRDGSKWVSMPEVMFMYRAGAYFANTVCPEVKLGLLTTEEVYDMNAVEVPTRPSAAALTERLEGVEEGAARTDVSKTPPGDKPPQKPARKKKAAAESQPPADPPADDAGKPADPPPADPPAEETPPPPAGDAQPGLNFE